MKNITIRGKVIGDGHPVYVIAEVGINHNGNVSLAKEMIQAAWEAGADAVKIQTFITKDFLHPTHPGFKYDIEAEIPHEQEQKIWDFARQKKINLFSTPEEFKSLTFIKGQKPALIKIAAMDFNYKDLIQGAARLKKPILLSSGMSTMEEVRRAVSWVRQAGNEKLIVLHCVSCYPAKPGSCNLLAIQTLKKALNCPVGFSDHTKGIHLAFAAAAMGANVIEKHFTINKKLPGPDQKCSMDPRDLQALVRQLRDLESARGNGKKVPAPEEKAPRLFKRRGVYAACSLKKGERLTEDKVLFFAPSSPGSSVSDWPSMAGKKLKKPISPFTAIKTSDLIVKA